MNRLAIATVLLLALAASAHAAPCPANGQPCINTITTDGNGNVVNPGSVTTAPTVTTWQATMALAAATSTALIDANVIKTANSAATPASFTTLTVINYGSNLAYMCPFGSVASATAGCEPIQPNGGSDTLTISPAAVPTFFSTLGTTLSFRNGS